MKMIKLSIDLVYGYRKAPRLDIYEVTFKIVKPKFYIDDELFKSTINF